MSTILSIIIQEKKNKGEKSTKHCDRFRLRNQREDNESETGCEREREKKKNLQKSIPATVRCADNIGT